MTRPVDPNKAHGFQRFRPTPKELQALARSIPADTRSLTARIAGDPLPGRSALDRLRLSKNRP